MTLPTPEAIEAARAAFDRAHITHRAFRNWLDSCDKYRDGRGPAPNPRRRPSKNKKHEMYAEADRLLTILGWDDPRPQTLDEVGSLLNRVSSEVFARV